jgi:type I restriction enzyme S subunit
MRMRVNPVIADAEFVYYFLAQPQSIEKLIRDSEHTGVPKINLAYLRGFPIWLPPLECQLRISVTLRTLDDRIALLRETNATLEAIAQALFKSWFVDFDPVRARMEGRPPEGMDDATAALFPDSFEESELGWVPRGWQLVRFGSLLSHTIGGDWGGELPDEVNEARVAIIRGTDIPDLRSGANSRVPIRYTSKKKLATRRLLDGDIVLEVSGGSKDQPTGRALYVTDGMLDQFDCPVEPASFCRLLRPISKHVGVLLAQHLTYIYAKGKTWEYQNQSTGIANFQTSHFLETELVAVPPPELLAMFSDIVRLTIERSHLTQIQQLATLRDTLLPRLISGQLRLPDAEAMAAETA